MCVCLSLDGVGGIGIEGLGLPVEREVSGEGSRVRLCLLGFRNSLLHGTCCWAWDLRRMLLCWSLQADGGDV